MQSVNDIALRAQGEATEASQAALPGFCAGAAAPPQKTGGAALGITAKSSAAFKEAVCQETGEIQRFRLDPVRREYVLVSDSSAARDGRYALQNVSRRILSGTKNPSGGEWRICSCLRRITGDQVQVMYSESLKAANFSGLHTCASPWICPVCSGRISERRKLEIETASDLHNDCDGGLYLVTFTFPHTRADELKSLMGSLRQALVTMRKHRRYKKILELVGYVGLIRAVEVTHSERSGWHPHLHELWFLNSVLTVRVLREFKSKLFEEWKSNCVKAGLEPPNRKAGLDIRRAESVAEYLSKFGNAPRWGVGAELTKFHAKTGKNQDSLKGRSPWRILTEYDACQDLTKVGQRLRLRNLFREYASAFFGVRQIFWSPGLKQVFLIKDQSDEEISEAQENDSKPILAISREQWSKLLKLTFDARASLLRVAETSGAAGVSAFLSSI